MDRKLRGAVVRGGILLLLLSLLLTLQVPVSRAGMNERVVERVLPNGLKTILLENHKVPVVTFQVWYRVGSRNEQWGKTGLSHMLEHMMFKGTKKVNPEEFSLLVQENGGNYNAFTSRDYTAYFETFSASHVNVALNLESDRMQNLVLRSDDFKTERMVVKEERRLRTQDNPKAYLMEQLDAAAFRVQPYHWPTVGWMQDLTRLTLNDLKNYYLRYYNPANAFVVAVGDFKAEDLFAEIKKAFGPIPMGAVPNHERRSDPPQSGERRVIVKREAVLPFMVMGYHVPNLRDPDGYVLEVMAAILSAGKSSRLHRDLVRGKRLALDTEADNSLLSYDPGLFMISAELLPDTKVAALEEALNQEVQRLHREPVGVHELQKAKNQLEASFIFGQDSLFYQAMLLAQHEIAVGWRAIDNYLPAIRRVTPEDIQRVARHYLIQDNRTVAILVPVPPKEGKSRKRDFSIKTRVVR